MLEFLKQTKECLATHLNLFELALEQGSTPTDSGYAYIDRVCTDIVGAEKTLPVLEKLMSYLSDDNLVYEMLDSDHAEAKRIRGNFAFASVLNPVIFVEELGDSKFTYIVVQEWKCDELESCTVYIFTNAMSIKKDNVNLVPVVGCLDYTTIFGENGPTITTKKLDIISVVNNIDIDSFFEPVAMSTQAVLHAYSKLDLH